MEDLNQLRRNRMVLLSIAGIPVTVILVATWLWYFVERGDLDLVGMLGTANRGTLVQPPRQLDDTRSNLRSFTAQKSTPKEIFCWHPRVWIIKWPAWHKMRFISDGTCR